MEENKTPKLPIVEMRSCQRCSERFGITCHQKRKKYCDKCKKIHYKEYRKEYNKKINYVPQRHILICERCMKEFIVGSGRPPKLCIQCLSRSTNPQERERAHYRRDYSAESEQIRLSNQHITSEDKTALQTV